MKKILLTGAYPYTEQQFADLRQLGCEIDFLQQEADAIENCQNYDGVVCNGLFLHHDIKNFTKLQYVQLTSAGFDRVPMEYIRENNITIRNARGVYSVPIAEHTVLLVLALLRNYRIFCENQRNRLWNKCRDLTELYGKTAVIAGCGSIGLEIAKRLSAFGMKVIGLDVQSVASEYLSECRNIDRMLETAQEADVFISSMPYMEQTHHIFNKDFFAVFNPNGVFVNIARGKLVDEPALIAALQTHQIKGAALDVFEEEPLGADSALWELDNVIITPHSSVIGDGNNKRMFDVIYENLKNWLGA